MLKKILLLICLLVALSGVASAEIISEVDDFDNTKYIYSYFRLVGEKTEDIRIKDLYFRKSITANSVEYILIFSNTEVGHGLKDRFSIYNDFLIKFDDDNNEIYTLSRKGEFSHYLDSGFQQIVLNVPENVISKILSSDKITLRIPLDLRHSGDKYKTRIRNFTFDVSQEMISEWRQVIQAE